MLAENVPSPVTARDTVGKARTLPTTPGAYQGLIASGVGSPLGGQTAQTRRFLDIDNQKVSPDIAGLTQPELALARIARHILSTRTTDKMDIAFVIDASQSMGDDINAVRDRLSQMTDLFHAENLDFTVGVVAFRESTGFALLGWNFEITPQTNSISRIKNVLSGIKCRGGEKALNALVRAAREVKFRDGAERRFILVTDEYVSGKYSAKEVLAQIQGIHIHIDVIGRDEHLQKFIAQRTDGMWLPISSLKD